LGIVIAYDSRKSTITTYGSGIPRDDRYLGPHCFDADRDYIAPQHAGETPAIRFPDRV
jgi:hypothetical protein